MENKKIRKFLLIETAITIIAVISCIFIYAGKNNSVQHNLLNRAAKQDNADIENSSGLNSDDVSENGYVKIGIIAMDNYAYQDANGKFHGYDIEYMLQICRYANLKAKFILFDNPNEAIAALQNNQIDILPDFCKNAERENKFLFSDFYFLVQSSSIYVCSDNSKYTYDDLSDFNKMKFGLLDGSIMTEVFNSWCDNNDIIPDITLFSSSESLNNALEKGNIDAAVINNYAPAGFSTILYFEPIYSYIMYRSNETAIKNRIDTAMGKLIAENPYYSTKLFVKYKNSAASSKVEFSATEKKYISEHNEITVAVPKDDKPYYFIKNGEDKGIAVEFYKKIAEKTGFKFVFKSYSDYASATNAVLRGDADLLGFYCDDIISAESQNLIQTNSVLSTNLVKITRSNDSADSLSGNFAIMDMDSSIILNNYQNIIGHNHIKAFSNISECYDALENYEADAIICSMTSASWLINQHNSNKFTISSISSSSIDITAAMLSKNMILCSILNTAINVLSDDLQSIVTKNNVTGNSLSAFVENTPPSAIIIFAVTAIFIIILLVIIIVLTSSRNKQKSMADHAALKSKEQEEKLVAATETSEERNEFFSGINHDMRTPLNAIIGFSELATRENVSDTVKEYLNKIQASGKLLLELINDSLTISKLNSGKLALCNEPMKVMDLISSIIVPIEAAAKDKNINFTYDISGCISGRAFYGDKINLQKIILNLLSNAVKYTPEGGEVKLILKNEYVDGKKIPESVITVSDNGIGINENFLPHIYDPFVQEQRKGYNASGTGLGLSIVKRLVELMDGTISVESKINKGTTFTVRFTFKEAENGKIITTESEKEGKIDLSHLAGKKVILCEDNELNAQIAVALLSTAQVNVTVMPNGSNGLDLFKNSSENEYDLILMDLRMPVMDGYTAARCIRNLNRPDAKSIPIIAMSADAFDDDVKRCLESGMNDHISKPIDTKKMFKTILKYLK